VHRVLQVCRSVLQCVSVRCSVLQCVVVCCSVLQCVAVWGRTLKTSNFKCSEGEVTKGQVAVAVETWPKANWQLQQRSDGRLTGSCNRGVTKGQVEVAVETWPFEGRLQQQCNTVYCSVLHGHTVQHKLYILTGYERRMKSFARVLTGRDDDVTEHSS